MDEQRRVAAVRRQMDYAARLKQDAFVARQLAVLLGVTIRRGKPLDAGEMLAAIEKAGFGKSDGAPVAVAGDAVANQLVAFVRPSETIVGEIDELNVKLTAFVLLANQLSSCLQIANSEVEAMRNVRNECVTLEERLVEKAGAITRLEAELAKAQLDRDSAFAVGYEQGAQQASMFIDGLAAEREKLNEKIDALDRCLSVASAMKRHSQ